ncbi:MAG: DNA-directed RNA polymerase subunit omega [Candidatus Omnitrophica bacterium]|nr:DNA-directed RNA polymerase subunit omega [Candidatus Omnitrophota bacterium]
MGYQPIEELLPQSNDSVYKLVILASRRAIEIAEGMPKLVEGVSSKRPATIALEEIRQKKVELKQSHRQEKKQEAKQEKKAKGKND